MMAMPERAASASAKLSGRALLQRKCACGSPALALAGECAECKSKQRLQAKLSIGASNDPLEQEADRVANQVLAMTTPAAVGGTALHIQRVAGTVGGQTDTAPDSVDRVLAAAGRPLDTELRARLEPRFGHDFSRVRVHTDAEAARSAQEIGARAYTAGEHVAFAAGEYSPGTGEGSRLLAHELAHVVQQSGSSAWGIQRQEAQPGRLTLPLCPCLTKPKRPDPEFVSQRMIDGWKGLRAKQGEQGEGCIETPYVAGRGEKVCTIGYGHQIKGCAVINAATGAEPTAEERKDRGVKLGCACAGQMTYDCKGPQAEKELLKDAQVKVNHVSKVVTVNLDQAQFDALVDIALHVGSIPKKLLYEVNLYGCSPAGWNRVREVYLNTSLTPQGSDKVLPGFVARRQHRVWPVAK